MVENKDHYDYWNKHRNKDKNILSRELNSLKLMSRIMQRGYLALDAGCGNGSFMKRVLTRFEGIKIKGLDFSDSEVREARKNGLDVSKADFSKKIPVRSGSFDLVYAGEVIEHLYDSDLFLTEINRVLKNKGYFVFSTPNLCAWFNRILMPLGIQPLFLEPSTKSKMVGAGFLKRFKKEDTPVGHVRIFTLEALKDMLRMYGFKLIEVRGASFDDGFPKPILIIDKFFNMVPSLSAVFVILAQKVRDN